MTGNFGEITDRFRDNGRDDPETYEVRADALRLTNKLADALVLYQRNLDYRSERIKQEPSRTDDRVSAARSHLFLGDYERGYQVLLAGFEQKAASTAEFARSISAVLRCRFRFSGDEAPDQREIQMDLLIRGITYDPTNELVLKRLLDAGLASESQRQFVDQTLSNAIDRLTQVSQQADDIEVERRNSMLWYARASLAWETKDRETAVQYLRKAYAADSQNALAANNLAYALADTDPTALDEAIKLSEQAMKLDASKPTYADTLATLLLKARQPARAVTLWERLLAEVIASDMFMNHWPKPINNWATKKALDASQQWPSKPVESFQSNANRTGKISSVSIGSPLRLAGCAFQVRIVRNASSSRIA